MPKNERAVLTLALLLSVVPGCRTVCPDALVPRDSGWRCSAPGCTAQRCRSRTGQEVAIYRFPHSWMGLEVNSYVIRGRSAIMIDAWFSRPRGQVEAELRRLPFPPRTIELLILTHAHFDHIGSARAVHEVTGARVLAHELDEMWPRVGVSAWPRPTRDWGSFIRAMLRTVGMPASPAVAPESLRDEGLSLSPWGIPGRVLFTPGHTAGTLSVLLDTGDAIVGDLVMNVFFLCGSRDPCLPVMAEDLAQVRASLARLLRLGATTFHLGHGPPVSAAVVRQLLADYRPPRERR